MSLSEFLGRKRREMVVFIRAQCRPINIAFLLLAVMVTSLAIGQVRQGERIPDDHPPLDWLSEEYYPTTQALLEGQRKLIESHDEILAELEAIRESLP